MLKITRRSNQPVINNATFYYKCTSYEPSVNFFSRSYRDHIDLLTTNMRKYILMFYRFFSQLLCNLFDMCILFHIIVFMAIFLSNYLLNYQFFWKTLLLHQQFQVSLNNYFMHNSQHFFINSWTTDISVKCVPQLSLPNEQILINGPSD